MFMDWFEQYLITVTLGCQFLPDASASNALQLQALK